jgi:hypothetical protein
MHLDRRNLKVTQWLQNELSDCQTVLDLGCGQSSLLQYVKGLKSSVGVEYWRPYIEESMKHGIHTEYVNIDILSLKYPANSFDSVILIDVLEHIKKEQALELIQRMQQWAKKKVIILVPNGFMPQGDAYGDGNEKQHHVSGWTVGELESLGYKVWGLDGFRSLRGDGADIIQTKTRLGHYLIAGISKLSEPFTEIIPKYAFHLFAVFDKQKLIQ